MLPTMIQTSKRVLLVYMNKALILDAEKSFVVVSQHLFPDPVLKVSQNSNTVILTTIKDKYMLEMTSGNVHLHSGSLFLESRPRMSDDYLFAEVSGSDYHERILGNSLSSASQYGDIHLSEMKGAYIADEDASLLTHSDTDLFFWAPINKLPSVQPDWEVYKRLESVAPIKRAAIDKVGRTAIVLTNSGILSEIPAAPYFTEHKLISDVCVDFVLVGDQIVYIDLNLVKVYGLNSRDKKDLFAL